MKRYWRIEYGWLLLCCFALALSVWWLPGSASVESDSYSVSYRGKRAIYQLVDSLNWGVERSTKTLIPEPGYSNRYLFLGPARLPTDREWDSLITELWDGGSVVFAIPSYVESIEVPSLGFTISNKYSQPEVEDTEDLSGEELESPFDQSLRSMRTDTELVGQQTLWYSDTDLLISNPSEWETLVKANGRPQVIKRQFGRGTLIVCSSDDIFNNGSLKTPNRALLAYRIIEAARNDGQTYFDETLNNSGVARVVGILFTPMFRSVTLQLILIALLFGWMGARRFGPVISTETHRRRNIAEHAEALGTLYYRAGAGSHAVRHLYEYLKFQLRRQYGANFEVRSPNAIAEKTKLPKNDLLDLFRDLKALLGRKSRRNATNAQAASALKRLSQVIRSLHSP